MRTFPSRDRQTDRHAHTHTNLFSFSHADTRIRNTEQNKDIVIFYYYYYFLNRKKSLVSNRIVQVIASIWAYISNIFSVRVSHDFIIAECMFYLVFISFSSFEYLLELC